MHTCMIVFLQAVGTGYPQTINAGLRQHLMYKWVLVKPGGEQEIAWLNQELGIGRSHDRHYCCL